MERTGQRECAQLRLTAVLLGLILSLGLNTGCSIKHAAVNSVGNALAASGSTFSSDDDPQLIRDAAPFSLKLMESLLAENPKHQKLLLATSRGFTQYSYAFIHQEADRWRDESLEKSDLYAHRARRMYLRARNYGLRGLALKEEDVIEHLRQDPKQAVQAFGKKDVPLLYWTGVAWAAAISLSKDDPALISDQPQVEAMIDRALALDESFDHGAIHTFLISYELARPGASSNAVDRATQHFERALELSNGQSAAPYVSMAESVAVQRQQRGEYEKLLQKALAIDPDAVPETRLMNLIVQERARWLLTRVDDLFLPLVPE